MLLYYLLGILLLAASAVFLAIVASEE